MFLDQQNREFTNVTPTESFEPCGERFGRSKESKCFDVSLRIESPAKQH